MPECFEVIKMANYLKMNNVIGTDIESFEFKNKGQRLLKNYDLDSFLKRIKGKTIRNIVTKAKFTFLQIGSDVLEWHYRFTGIPHIRGISYDGILESIYTLPISGNNTQNSLRFTLKTSHNHYIDYVDTRCLSHINYYLNCDIKQTNRFKSLPSDLNSDPYVNSIDIDKYGHWSLKKFLLNQNKSPSGIGNYLACEICSYANIHPNKRLNRLNAYQVKNLNNAIKNVSDFALKNVNYSWFKVFNRKQCLLCRSEIIKEKFSKNEQTSHWCSQCQQIEGE